MGPAQRRPTEWPVDLVGRRCAGPTLPGTFDLPPQVAGMECIAIIDETIPVTFRFRDQPRADGASFVKHLAPNHHFDRVMIVSGDRESEVRYLAELVGIHEVRFSQSPEQKLAIVPEETQRANTVFVGDGINDAPALTSASRSAAAPTLLPRPRTP